MTKEEFTKIAWEKFQKWSKSQEGQISGYEYEKSFDKMMIEMGQDLLQNEVAKTGEEKQEKKR